MEEVDGSVLGSLELLEDTGDLEEGEGILPVVLGLCLHRRKALRAWKSTGMNVTENYTPDDFRRRFRVTAGTFDRLLEFLEEFDFPGCARTGTVPGRGRPPLPLRKQLMVYLLYMGTQESMEGISDLFGISSASCCRIVRRITKALCSGQDRFIVWPRTAEDVAEVGEGFRNLCGIPGVLGAIDGSHITIKPPLNDEQSYYNRKKQHSIIVQGVCDSNMLFTDIYAGWPGSTHDSRVLRNSPLYDRAETNPAATFPGNTFLLADSAYAARPWMAPTLKLNAGVTAAQRKYSSAVAEGRVVIEQAWGLLKVRWRRLNYLDVDLEWAPYIILAGCILHNICTLTEEAFDDFLVSEDDVGHGDDVEDFHPPQPGGAALVQHLTAILAALP